MGLFGENLTFDQLSESEIFVGDIFSIGTAMLQATMPRIPCSSLMTRFQNKLALKEFAQMRRPGVYFRVLEEGDVQAGDQLKYIENPEVLKISMMDIWSYVMEKQMDASKANMWLEVGTHHNQISTKLKKYLELK
jgi:MOSC domain-containing protein YiiM